MIALLSLSLTLMESHTNPVRWLVDSVMAEILTPILFYQNLCLYIIKTSYHCFIMNHPLNNLSLSQNAPHHSLDDKRHLCVE